MLGGEEGFGGGEAFLGVDLVGDVVLKFRVIGGEALAFLGELAGVVDAGEVLPQGGELVGGLADGSGDLGECAAARRRRPARRRAR